MQQIPLELDLAPPISLDGFIGSDNLMLRAMIAMQSERRGEDQLFIHGPKGIGKTHLAQAACFHAGKRGLTAAYLPMDLLKDQFPQASEGLEYSDLVVIDDVQRLAGSDENEFALFDLINRLRDHGTPLLLTANKPPARLKVKLPDLASRLSWGAVVKVHPPSDAEKIELLQSKARARGFDLPFDVAVYLLQRIPRDTGSLLAMVQRLDRATLSAQRKLTRAFVRQILLEQESA